MKKINAFYCIKTPSDWKESVLMYDKPTEKNKTKLTGFQLAGAVLAAILLVAGGAMTLFRDEGDIEITPSASSAAQEESSAQDSSQTAEIDYGKAAEEGLLKLISDDEIVIEGIFAGATSNGDCYIFVDKIYSSAKPYVEVNDDIKDVYDVASLMSANRVLRFKVDFGVKDKTTGKAVYAQDIDIGSAVVIGTKFEDDISFVTAYDIVTHYDTTEDWQGDGVGTQLYSELCGAVAAVHDIETSTDEGEKKLKQQVLQCAVNAGRGGMLTDSGVEIVSNYKQRTDSLGIKWQALGNCSAYDYVTSKITIDFPISVTPLKDYKNTTTEVVKTTDEGAVVKIGERYYSLTSNWNNAVKFSMADVNGEKDFDGIYTHKANFFDDNKQWILDVRFVSHLSAFFNDDFKIYLNEVDTPEKISDKTDNSDVVMTYHSIYTRSGEVVYPGGSGDIIKGK